MGVPKLNGDPDGQKLTKIMSIWVTEQMFEDMTLLKSQCGRYQFTRWLRKLWELGIEEEKRRLGLNDQNPIPQKTPTEFGATS